MTEPLPFSLLIFLVALGAGALPLVTRWSDRALHLFIAFASGVFLGAVFLHLLPEVAASAPGGLDDGHPHGGGGALWLFVLIGVLFVYFLEALLIQGAQVSGGEERRAAATGQAPARVHVHLHAHAPAASLVPSGSPRGHAHAHPRDPAHTDAQDAAHADAQEPAAAPGSSPAVEAHRQHTVVSYAAFAGLGVHALTAGFGLAIVLRDGLMGWPLLISMVIHKGAESFSLGTVFVLSSFRKGKILGLQLAFAALTPAGVLLGAILLSQLAPASFSVLTALAAGTFLYVALCELLPEVFHHRVDVGRKILLLSLGVGVIYLLHHMVE